MKNTSATHEYLATGGLNEVNHSLPAEYLLVLKPHEELWNEIKSIKQKFADEYSCETARKGWPHVALITFKQYQATENRITQSLRNITRMLSPFKIEMKDFGSFPSHTIFINIVSKVPIVNAIKELRQAQKFMKIDKDNKPHFITEPYLTIARKLQPWQYEKAWLEYQHANFHGRFIAEHALLLKRKQGEPYKPVEKFMFLNEKEAITQCDLFNL